MKALQFVGKLILTLALATGLFAVTGCGLTKPASASFASVVIHGHTMKEIQNAAGHVFTADGYNVMVRDHEMKCEKQGSRAAELAYEGLAGNGPVNVRVLASIVQLSETSYRLECQAFIVKSPGDAVMEEVIRLQNIRSRPYQDLLDKVAKELQ
jgi:hypothetical protein